MKIIGTVGKIYPQREGTSKKSGKPYKITELHFFWVEEGVNGSTSHIQKCSTMQDVDMVKLKMASDTHTSLTAQLYFDVRESSKQPGSFFNDVKILLPKSVLMERNESPEPLPTPEVPPLNN